MNAVDGDGVRQQGYAGDVKTIRDQERRQRRGVGDATVDKFQRTVRVTIYTRELSVRPSETNIGGTDMSNCYKHHDNPQV